MWLARNVMGTFRAIKIIWKKQFESERPFEREFTGIQSYEPLSRSADGLVHVLQVGRNDAEGLFYYVMELADDGSISATGAAANSRVNLENSNPEANSGLPNDSTAYTPRTLRSEVKTLGRLATADCLRIAIDIASGLAQLHRRGLVHRDVKPGNIIYVGGRAKLADIGLVTTSGERATFVGTEGYIPPEGPGSPRADLYALGIALYEASTGFAPDKFPRTPAEWFHEDTPAEPVEFHQVILKASEADPARRYANIEAMQADLALLQSGQSVRRLRTLELRLNWWRRVGGITAVLAALALLAIGLVHYRAKLLSENFARESRLRGEAQKARVRAEDAENTTRQELCSSLIAQARATVRSGELGQRVDALNAIHQAASMTNTAELRGIALAALLLPDFRFQREIPTGPGVTLAQMDPAFQRIALSRRGGDVDIYSISANSVLTTLPASVDVPAYAGWWSPDGRYFAVKRDKVSGGRVATVEVWDAGTARLALLLPDVAWGAVSFHPKRNQIIAGRVEGGVSIWDLENGRLLEQFALPGPTIRLCFGPEGDRFAAVCESPGSETVLICDVTNATPRFSHAFSSHVGTLDWQPHGRWISVPDTTGAVTLLDSHSGKTLLLGYHKAEAVTTAFTSDGAYLVSGSWDRELIGWDLRTLQKSVILGVGSFLIQFQNGGSQCAIITDAGVQIHSFDEPNGRHFLQDLGSRVRAASFSPDGRWLAAASDEMFGVWDLSTNRPGILLPGATEGSPVFVSNTELLANRNGEGVRWKIVSGPDLSASPELKSLDSPNLRGLISISTASNHLALTSTNGSCFGILPNAVTETPAWAPTEPGLSEISPDAHWLGIYSPFSPVLNVYGLPGFKPVASLTNETAISGFSFSPSGEEVAIASHNSLEFWSTKTWTLNRKLPNFIAILFQPDGRTAWLNQSFRSAGLYDLRTLELLLPLPVGFWPLAVSQDGRKLAVRRDARQVEVLDLAEIHEQFRSLGIDWQ